MKTKEDRVRQGKRGKQKRKKKEAVRLCRHPGFRRGDGF